MKKILSTAIFALATLFASSAFSDAVYYYQNPTYIPSAISPAVSFSAPSTTYVVTLQNIAVVAFEINGTCTSLAATVQVSVDGTTWRAVNVYPVATGTITAAASISAAGAYRVSTAGAQKVRLNISALTAACSVSAVGTSAGVALTL